MKIYITAGHTIVNGKGTGAFGVNGFDEAVEARRFVNDVIKKFHQIPGFDKTRVITDDDSWSLGAVINWLSKKVTKECISIEFHFNAFHNPTATGAEVLVANNHTLKEASLALALSLLISETLGIKNRGMKTEAQSGRKKLGILSGGASSAINLLVEICFISNQTDINRYRSNYWNLVEKTAALLNKNLNVK